MRALITQRELVDKYGISVDMLESSYISFFEKLEVKLQTVSNFYKDVFNTIKINNIDLLIVIGGGTVNSQYYDIPHNDSLQINRDLTEKMLIEAALSRNIPILAICRGMQYINGLLGGKISKLDKMKTERRIGLDHPIQLKSKTIFVNNYHNAGIYSKNLAKELSIVGLDTSNDIVEAYYSKKMKILGLQWHPERSFSDSNSYLLSEKLVIDFIKNKGLLDESYYSVRW